MKTSRLLSVAIILGAIVASGQDCKPDDLASLTYAKDAVRRVTTTHFYSGWDDKAFNRSGDMAAVAIVQTLPAGEMISSPDKVKEVLTILRLAFACPSRCVTARSDRQPNVTMLLFEHLHNSTSGPVQSEVDETREYVLQQTRDIE